MIVKVGDILPCYDGLSYRVTALELVLIDIIHGLNYYVVDIEDPDGDEYIIALGAGPEVPPICRPLLDWYDSGSVRDHKKWVVMETGLLYYEVPAAEMPRDQCVCDEVLAVAAVKRPREVGEPETVILVARFRGLY